MNTRGSDVYLNTLCLAAWAPGPSTMKLAKAAIRTYEDLSPEDRTMITPINMLYIKLIREVIDGKLDLSNLAEAQNTLAQYENDPAFKTNKSSYDEMKTMLCPKEAPSPAAIRRLTQRIKNNIIWSQNSARIRKLSIANQRASMNDDPDKQAELLKKILEDAAEFAEIYNSQVGDEESDIIEEIDFDDPSTLMHGLKLQHKKRDAKNIIKFGWQGLNELFDNKACYGMSLAYAGLSHNGKSLILQGMCVSHMMYNTPPDCGGRKPLILFISLENEAHENLKQFHYTLYTNTFHREPVDLTDEEICNYLLQALCKTGFHLKIVRRLGESFGYTEYATLVKDLEEKKGYKVVATYLDYITLCKHESADSNLNDARQIENVVKRFSDHANQHGIFFCTAFQLDADAARIKQSGQSNTVRRYTEAVLADAKGSIRPLDGLAFNDIEINHVGASYLCLAWRKSRYGVVPKEQRYCAYRFGPLGILFDLKGKPQYVRDIYAEDATSESTLDQKVDIF